ncbi:hypothetical protein BVRB_6g137020 [Beta vulgaris subsp. vulgaris]|nr:hypothetical protein BVRB_6g137020 [Beta vulgaris subsp. vulgaris]
MADEAPKSQHEHEAASNSDLMASAKTVAEAAQLACTQKTDQIDKAKVSEAAEDVLEAAKSYGKLDDKSGVGQYVDKVIFTSFMLNLPLQVVLKTRSLKVKRKSLLLQMVLKKRKRSLVVVLWEV